MSFVKNKSSFGKRFSFTTISVVALIALVFCTIVIIRSNLKIDDELKERTKSVAEIAGASLKLPLLNSEKYTIDYIIKALFNDEKVVYFRLFDANGVIDEMKVPEFDKQSFSFFAKSSQFKTETSDIYYEGKKIGAFELALSKKSYWRELMANILSVVLLTVVIITAIFLTATFMTRRYILGPLKKLEKSVIDIAQKNLDTEIDTSGKDEIGNLARAFFGMRNSIKYLFDESNRQKEELEQKLSKTEAEFRKIEKKFNAVLDDIRKGVYWKNIDGVILGGNRFSLDYLGLKKQEEFKKGKAESYAWEYKETANIFRNLAKEAIAEDQPRRSERNSIIDNSGKQKWLDISCTPLKDNTGNIADVLVTFEDITEKVELGKTLEETKERLEKTTTDISNLIHTFLHPVLKFYLQSELLHQLGNILYKSIRCMTPIKPDIKESGKQLEDKLTEIKNKLEAVSNISESAAALVPIFENIINILDYRLIHSGESKILFDKAVRDAALRILTELGGIGFFEEEHKNEGLKDVITDKFIESLRNILFSNLIRTTGILKGETQVMKREVETLRRYIGMRKKKEYLFGLVNLKDLLDRNTELFEPLLMQKDIELEYLPSGDLFASISKDDIDRVIGNLMHNAIKYSYQGSQHPVKIEVQALPSENAVQFSISNIGIPIKREEIDNGDIFKFGKRSELVYRIDRDGTGVGLADAKEVVEAHGGEISITSEPVADDGDPPEYKVPYLTTVNIRIPKTRK